MCKKNKRMMRERKKKQSRSFFTQTRPSCADWRKPGNKKTCHNWIFLQIILIFFPRYREWGIHDLSWNSAFVTIQRSISGAKKKVLIYKSYCWKVLKVRLILHTSQPNHFVQNYVLYALHLRRAVRTTQSTILRCRTFCGALLVAKQIFWYSKATAKT